MSTNLNLSTDHGPLQMKRCQELPSHFFFPVRKYEALYFNLLFLINLNCGGEVVLQGGRWLPFTPISKPKLAYHPSLASVSRYSDVLNMCDSLKVHSPQHPHSPGSDTILRLFPHSFLHWSMSQVECCKPSHKQTPVCGVCLVSDASGLLR